MSTLWLVSEATLRLWYRVKVDIRQLYISEVVLPRVHLSVFIPPKQRLLSLRQFSELDIDANHAPGGSMTIRAASLGDLICGSLGMSSVTCPRYHIWTLQQSRPVVCHKTHSRYASVNMTAGDMQEIPWKHESNGQVRRVET